MPLVRYSLYRLGILVVVAALLWPWLGAWAIVVAAVVALLLSYLFLRGPRDRAAVYLADRAERRKQGTLRISGAIDADDAAEDEIADRIREDGAR